MTIGDGHGRFSEPLHELNGIGVFAGRAGHVTSNGAFALRANNFL
jgi:hypothetical protein